MPKIRNSSIKVKLTWMNMLVSATAVLLASVGFIGYELTTFRTGMIRSMSIRAQIVAASSASALLFSDSNSAQTTLSALDADPNILFAGVYTLGREPLALYWREGESRQLPDPPRLTDPTESFRFADTNFSLIRTVLLDGKPVGMVYLRSDLRERNDRLQLFAAFVGVILLMSLLGGLAVSSMFQRSAIQPVLQLAETARIVARDKLYSIRAPVPVTRDEIATVIDAFNDLLAQNQERDAALLALNQSLERRVAERTMELQASNQELEAFTYSVAHDLRAPLRHIQGFSAILMEDLGAQLDPSAAQNLERIVGSTQHMGRLIDDLLSLARIGRQPLRLRLTRLDTVMEEVLRDVQLDTKDREIDWRVGALPPSECDPGLMRQVFYNLLSNAAKYTRPRKPAVIETGLTEVEGQPAIYVRDNGVGFNMKYANKLFGVFQRLHRREDFEGTGVGLATVQRIIHKHGGRIWAEAELDKGATFYFTLSSIPAVDAEEAVLAAGGTYE